MGVGRVGGRGWGQDLSQDLLFLIRFFFRKVRINNWKKELPVQIFELKYHIFPQYKSHNSFTSLQLPFLKCMRWKNILPGVRRLSGTSNDRHGPPADFSHFCSADKLQGPRHRSTLLLYLDTHRLQMTRCSWGCARVGP